MIGVVSKPMADVTIYLTRLCPFCIRARRLLDRKGIEYSIINVAGNRELRDEMNRRSQRHTVPQIFIDDLHVGGFDDLAALDAEGKLDELLGLA